MPSQQVILELQSLGARIDVPVEDLGRRGGAGPSDDKAFMLAGVAAMVPTLGEFAHRSPYAVTADAQGGYCLTHNGEQVMPVEFAPRPRFYSLTTAGGVSYRQIAVLHGRDVLATTVAQRCVRWRREGERCQFCAIERSLENASTIALKTPQQLAEVAEAAVRLDGVRHMVLTTGTMNYRDMGVRYLARCVRAIKAAVSIGVQAQFEPPEHLDDLVLLRDAGTDTVGMHLESFSQATRERITPGKATISIDRYFEAFGGPWRSSVGTRCPPTSSRASATARRRSSRAAAGWRRSASIRSWCRCGPSWGRRWRTPWRPIPRSCSASTCVWRPSTGASA